MNLDLLMNLIGGLPGLLKTLIRSVMDRGEERIDETADRILTISEKDHRGLCRWADKGMAEAEIQEGLALARKAGDACGDYAAWLARRKLQG